MKRPKLIIFISILSITLFVLFSYLPPSVLADNNSFSFKNKFADHTYVGPFNISNTKTKQAKSKLATDISELQSKVEVNLIYQDAQFDLAPESIEYDIDMTLANAQTGEDNPIIAHVSRNSLQTILSQELPAIQFTDDAVESIAAGIEIDLQTGIMPQSIRITDYIETNAIAKEVVALSDYQIDSISPAFSKALQTLNETELKPYEVFSVLDLLVNPEIGALSDEEMTILSSILYTAVLQTNFQIDERTISTSMTTAIQPGFEAAINQTLGLDFKFSNPNPTSFTINSNWSNGKIQLSISGLPFYYSYKPYVANVEEYEPRTVVQYSSFARDGQVLVSEEGKKGIEAIVQRTLSLNGNIIETEDVSKDFYAPLNRVEVHPLSEGESTNDTDHSTTDNTSDVDNPEGGKIVDGNVITDGLESVSEEPETGGADAGTTDGGSDNGDSSTPAGQGTQSDQNIEYDKSGLPIGGK